jgi:hypothetical protein
MKVVLRNPPLLIVMAAIVADIPLRRSRKMVTPESTVVRPRPEVTDWPRRFFASIPPRIDPA